MTKNNTILRAFLMAVAALCIFAAATVFGISIFEEWLGIIVGVLIMGAAIPLHLLGKKQKFLYFLSFLFNTAGCGFSASAYYVTAKINAELGELFAAALIAIIFLFVATVVYCFTTAAFNAACITLCVLDAALASFAVYGWITEGDAFFSFLCFSCIVAVFYIFAMKKAAKEHETCEIMRTVSLHSFGIFVLVTIIVILIISEGDGIDGFDIGDIGDGKKKKKNKATAKALALGVLDAADDTLAPSVLRTIQTQKKTKTKKENSKNENPENFE